MSWYRASLVHPVRKTDGSGLTDVMRGDLLEILGDGPEESVNGVENKVCWGTYVVRVHRKQRLYTDVEVFMPKPMFAKGAYMLPLSPLEQLAQAAEA